MRIKEETIMGKIIAIVELVKEVMTDGR